MITQHNNVFFHLQAISDYEKTKAVLTNNYISKNHCFGVCVKKDSKIFAADNDDPEHGIQLEMTNNVFEENAYGDVGHFPVTTVVVQCTEQ